MPAIAAPVGLGLFSLGLAFGLVVVHAGLVWWWATVFTAVVYAGSLEFLLAGLAVAATPLAQVAATTLIVNLRHVTDEGYAVTSAEPRNWTLRSIVLVQFIFQVA